MIITLAIAALIVAVWVALVFILYKACMTKMDEL